MGILNVTPDSFSDGGRFNNEPAIRSQIERMIDDGADIIDVGGESSRPFSQPVSLEEELDRVVPVIKAIRDISSIPISIDTTKAEVAQRSLDIGADIVNDISALRTDPAMTDLIASRIFRCERDATPAPDRARDALRAFTRSSSTEASTAPKSSLCAARTSALWNSISSSAQASRSSPAAS